MTKNSKRNGWILPATLILFILSVLTLPLMVVLTYAGRSETPKHVITFANEQLTWDDDTHIQENGVAELSFFSTVYQNVHSENEDNVVAPGTDALTTIRLKNDSDSSAEYTAVCYMIKPSDELPVHAGMEAEGSVPTENYQLPEGVENAQVLSAVTGVVGSKEIKDFDVNWYWIFYESDEQDIRDTALGNKAAWEDPDDVLLGFYIVVEGETPVPPPHTGTVSWLWVGIAFVVISGALFIVEFILNRKRKKEENAEG